MSEEISYRHTPEMGEISGFGGGYEACCQDMLEAGVKWLVAEQAKRAVGLEMTEYKNIYGVLNAENDDAKELEKAVLAAAKGEATGAMHHAVMGRLGFIAKNGWETYVAELSRNKDDDDDA